MDKPIIIDGCDVSGCEYIDNDKCCNLFEGLIGDPCSSYTFRNCHYKNWKRKEQECNRLEKQNEILLGQLVINDGENATIQISQSQFEEYNQLKTENKRLDNELYMTVEEGRAWYDLMERYEQVLKEIKEIAADESYVGFWDEQISKIQQKISEVLDV